MMRLDAFKERWVLPQGARTFLLNAFAIAAVVVIVLVLATTLWRVWFNDPPIRLRSTEPLMLGILCPGDDAHIHLEIEINEPVIVHYYISVMDAKGEQNIVGTPRAYTDMLHPRPARFETVLPWRVPDRLPPGRYRRVVATRNVAGTQNSIFVERFFEVGAACPEPAVPR